MICLPGIRGVILGALAKFPKAEGSELKDWEGSFLSTGHLDSVNSEKLLVPSSKNAPSSVLAPSTKARSP